jgi:hypothetical protein
MISEKFECVFVHVPKVAGQSVERVFLELHGLTWDERASLLLRPNAEPALGPPRLAHLTAEEYVACGHLTAEEWGRFFTFSFVRNPWARAVSFYKYIGLHRHLPFATFARRLADEYWHDRYWFVRPQADFVLGTSGRPQVDFIGRLETIDRDFKTVCRRLGLAPRALPHSNHSSTGPFASHYWTGVHNLIPFVAGALRQMRFTHERYTDYYPDAATVDRIGRLYAADVEHFGYAFGKPAPADVPALEGAASAA